jgi:uncharacterized protein (TIGR00297 family)
VHVQEQSGRAGDGSRLRWQSWLVLAAVAPWCAIATIRYAMAAWSGATRTGLLISLVLALLVWLARAATPLAALMGGLLTAVLTLAPGSVDGRGASAFHSALLPLLVLFLLTWAATRFERSSKQSLGVAEDKRGRNAAQVAANLGVAGLGAAAALSHLLPDPLYAVIVVAVLAEATADTLASEMGAVLGGPPFMITTLRRVAPGSDGAISLAGTVAGTSGALLVALAAMPALGLSIRSAVYAGLGAIGGLFFDSFLGATAERRGWLNNDAVNFLSTIAAAVLATALLLLR